MQKKLRADHLRPRATPRSSILTEPCWTWTPHYFPPTNRSVAGFCWRWGFFFRLIPNPCSSLPILIARIILWGTGFNAIGLTFFPFATTTCFGELHRQHSIILGSLCGCVETKLNSSLSFHRKYFNGPSSLERGISWCRGVCR